MGMGEVLSRYVLVMNIQGGAAPGQLPAWRTPCPMQEAASEAPASPNVEVDRIVGEQPGVQGSRV